MSSTGSSIYTGFWINWSYGRVNGSTITLSAENSAYLIAFIALFVRVVGGQLWAVLAFLVSVNRSTAEPKDALFHQQQAILRNTSQPTGVLWAMLKLSWAWKRTAKRAKTRTFTFVFTSLVYIAAFAVASVFSSKISSADSEVLVLPAQNCGFWPYPYLHLFNPDKQSWQDYSTQRAEYGSNSIVLEKKSHEYVARCYNSTADSPNEPCLPYGKSRIDWSTNLHTACPFDKDMCIADAIQFDTGFLNSHTHFGINSRDARVEYRRVMTCAPITTDGYVSGYVNASGLGLVPDAHDQYQGETWLKYTYGQSYSFEDNTTYAYSDYSYDFSIGSGVPQEIFNLNAEVCLASSLANETNPFMISSFTAIAPLVRPDFDTTLIFFTRNASFLSEVRDPWFWSTVRNVRNETVTGTLTRPKAFYTADARVGVVACAEQHQLRNPITGASTALGGGFMTSNEQAERLGFNDDQLAVFNRSFVIATYEPLAYIVQDLSARALLATGYQTGNEALGLPDNQWQLELNHWFGIALHTMQLWTQQYVTGPSRPLMKEYIVPSTEGFLKEMCTNQIVPRTDYRSFNVLGLAIIFAFGFFIIIVNLTIGCLMEQIQKHTLQGRYRNAEWQANEFLQLQRMAYEHKNMGTWTGQRDLVPRTNPGEVFMLPDSTKWNNELEELPDNSQTRIFRSLSRGWSHKAENTQSAATESNNSGSGMDNKPVVSTTADAEKVVQILETPVG